MPAYLSKFRCIGSACESNCCGGWTLPVDRESYERYQAVSDPEFGPALRRHVTLIENPASTNEWAQLEAGPAGVCAFLTADRLCGLHLSRGLDFLCLTCATYPRVSTRVDGEIERAATLSCPEVARLVLFDSRAMTMVRRSEAHDGREALAADITTASASAGDPMAFFPLIRHLTLKLLKNRRAPLETRLVALGLALERLSRAAGDQTWTRQEQGDRLTSAQALSEDQVRAAFEPSLKSLPRLRDLTAHLVPDYARPLAILRGLEPRRFFGLGPSARYVELVERIEQSLGLHTQPLDRQIARYGCASRDVFAPYLARRPYLLENLMVNHVHASSFPFTLGRSFYDEFLMLAARYVLVKSHLVGLAAEGELTDGLVVELVHLLQRAVEHTRPYQEHILGLLQAGESLPAIDTVGRLIVS